MRKLLLQIIKFGGVGIICFLIDYGVLFVLTEFAGLYYLLSSAISFSISVVVNYILSVLFVFDTNKENKHIRNFVLFVIFSIIGLFLTTAIMKLGVDVLSWNYMFVKIFATGIVMVYNFITRKLFLEQRKR